MEGCFLGKKLAMFIGILTILIFTVSSASAFVINTVNKPGDVPAGAEIKIDVTYDETANTITFVDISTGLTNSRIKGIAYNLSLDAVPYDSKKKKYIIQGFATASSGTVFPATWKSHNNFGSIGVFDHLDRGYKLNPSSQGPFKKVVVTLPSEFDGTIPGEYQVEAHLAWDSPKNPATSIFVSGSSEGTHTSGTPNGSIPEFPSIALPVAAIMGIMFFMGRRKTE